MSDESMSKKERCRYCHPLIESGRVFWRCYKDRKEGVYKEITDESICENCADFNSRYIEYPITVNKINIEQRDDWSMRKEDVGKLALIRPCGKQYGDKTYVGVFLGDLPCWQTVSFHRDEGELTTKMVGNPAIFVPELKKVVYGCESWWHIVEEGEDISKEITDDLIQNQWYVRIAKMMDRKD